MSAIRPGLPPMPAVPTGQAPPMRAAQAAFFRAAMAEVQATPASTQTRASAPTAAAPSDSGRLPRLGQLLDIRV